MSIIGQLELTEEDNFENILRVTDIITILSGMKRYSYYFISRKVSDRSATRLH